MSVATFWFTKQNRNGRCCEIGVNNHLMDSSLDVISVENFYLPKSTSCSLLLSYLNCNFKLMSMGFESACVKWIRFSFCTINYWEKAGEILIAIREK